MRRAALASLAVAILLVSAKLWGYWQTGSVALLASLFDSLLDCAASLVNFLAVRISLTPADREHRFGHGKAEALAGLGQALLILVSASFVGYQAVRCLIEPAPIEQSVFGIAVMIFSILVTLLLVLFQRFVLRRTGALAIAADSLHYKGDILTNIGVLLALALSGLAGVHIADPLIALVIAAVIMRGAWQIVIEANDQLLDRELPEEERQKIRNIALSIGEVRNVHQLKTRISGRHRFIQLHLELDGRMELFRAHQIADRVEAAIGEAFPGAEVLIHEDPAGLQEEHPPVGAR
jgi:ferrous-iron efflux pump FieF